MAITLRIPPRGPQETKDRNESNEYNVTGGNQPRTLKGIDSSPTLNNQVFD